MSLYSESLFRKVLNGQSSSCEKSKLLNIFPLFYFTHSVFNIESFFGDQRSIIINAGDGPNTTRNEVKIGKVKKVLVPDDQVATVIDKL